MAIKFKHHPGEAPGAVDAPGASADSDHHDTSRRPAIARAFVYAGGTAMLLAGGTYALLRFKGDAAPIGTHIPGISAPGGNVQKFAGDPNDPNLPAGRSPIVDFALSCKPGEQVVFAQDTGNTTYNGNTQTVSGEGARIDLQCAYPDGTIASDAPQIKEGENPDNPKGAYGAALCANNTGEVPTLTATTNVNEVELTSDCGPGKQKDAGVAATLGSIALVP
jgi:hypothetical protein